jgi:Mn2+/Fe2+ NRAMP family transporter
MTKKSFTAISGAAFLMATSAIGPGFINNTTLFTRELAASFGFVILISILLDIIIQLNLWRIITLSGERAPRLASKALPGSGELLSVLVAAGGLIFNIGNIAGAALGLQVLFDWPLWLGASVSALLGIAVLVIKEAGRAMDWFARILGAVMILLTAWVCITAAPDTGEALKKTIIPDTIDIKIIITIVGGTVGGYISFAGAHRLLDAGITGPAALPRVSKGAVSGITIASLMRYLLFLAALGVLAQGALSDPGNPAKSVFQTAAGAAGVKIFGLVLWSAAITSIVGSAFTSVSFIECLSAGIAKKRQPVIILFIIISLLIFILAKKTPVRLLTAAGEINGMILPLAMGIIMWAVQKNETIRKYQPAWMMAGGWAVVLLLGSMSAWSLGKFFF